MSTLAGREDNDELESLALARGLRRFSLEDAETRLSWSHRNISAWPLGVELPEEGDIPSELTPSRTRRTNIWDEIVEVPKSPLGEGDFFVVQMVTAQRNLGSRWTYRVLGRFGSGEVEFALVERLTPGVAAYGLDEPPPDEAEPMLVRLADDPDERVVQVELGSTLWELDFDARGGHVARPVRGTGAYTGGHTRPAIASALVEFHRIHGVPAPSVGGALRRRGQLIRRGSQAPETYRWMLLRRGPDRRREREDQGELTAWSLAQAVELATHEAFGGVDMGEPTTRELGTRTWGVWGERITTLTVTVTVE